MAPIVDPSWLRMGSDLENPFQNVPGRFIYALPDLRSSLSFGPSTSGVPSTPSPPHSPLEGQVEMLPCDESGFDHDGCPDTTTQGESVEPNLGETDPVLDANIRSDSHRTHTPSLLSPTSSTSSEKGRTTEKTKRSRRPRRRNRPVVDVGGCVMGPRMVLFHPYWALNRIPAIVPPGPWSPGYRVVSAGGNPGNALQTVPGY